MIVPLLDLNAQNARMRKDILGAFEEVLRTNRFILGPKVSELEEKIAACCGSKYAIGVSSGTDALLLSLMALGIKPGDEVITTAFTFFATAGAISRLGAIPVFVDIDRQIFNIDSSLIKAKVTKKTKAILPVHLFGQMAEMNSLMAIARDLGIPLIEDAAQSIGAKFNKKSAGSFGDLGCFSFFPSKNLGGFGDGGMIITSDGELAEKCRLLRTHGAKPKYFHSMVGGNFRLDELQAAGLLVKLSFLDEQNFLRRKHACIYDRGLMGYVDPPHIHQSCFSIYNQYTIMSEHRDQLKQQLKDAGISTAIYYPLPLHLQECYSHLGYKEGDLPITEAVSKKVLSLPIYAELSKDQIDHVINSVRQAVKPS